MWHHACFAVIHASTGPARSASGAFDPRPRRSHSQEPRLSVRHPSSSPGRPAAGNTRQSRGCGRVRRAEQRQRRRRIHAPRDRLAQGAAARGEALSRHLPRRADPGAPPRQRGLLSPGRPSRDRVLPDPPDQRRAGDMRRWPDHVYQWHREGFDLPRGAQLLAEGDAFPVQAFRWGPCAYAVQFHAGSHPRHDVPVDDATGLPGWNSPAPSNARPISMDGQPMILPSGLGSRLFSTNGSGKTRRCAQQPSRWPPHSQPSPRPPKRAFGTRRPAWGGRPPPGRGVAAGIPS